MITIKIKGSCTTLFVELKKDKKKALFGNSNVFV